jgi:hypothetical protein
MSVQSMHIALALVYAEARQAAAAVTRRSFDPTLTLQSMALRVTSRRHAALNFEDEHWKQ